jgi:two-component system, NarL family, response regulator NreC
MSKLRILVADDHTIVRQGLCSILKHQTTWDVVAEASSGREAVDLVRELRPDVAILDVAMPQLNGIEAARQAVRQVPSLRILMLSMHAEDAYIEQALKAGAHGYLLKDSADADLIRAVMAVASGKSYFSPVVACVLLNEFTGGQSHNTLDKYDSLSVREREVFQLVAEGHTTKGIADLLCLSALTVDKHRAHIFKKLAVRNVAELVRYAVRRGVVS